MEQVYVFGHRNPDTDSIVSAMAYAALRNALGDREYEAVALGQPTDETRRILHRFGFRAPRKITDVFTQVRDLDFDTPPIMAAEVTVGRAWTALQSQKGLNSVAVANEDGTLFGLLAREDMANYNMNLVASSYLRPVPIFNLLSVLEGKLISENEEFPDAVSGELTIAMPYGIDDGISFKKDSIVICGNQPDMIRRCLELNVNCLILCQTQVTEELRRIPTQTTVIMTPYDAYRAIRLIFQSVPVGRVCQKRNINCFHLNDRLDEVKEQVLKYKDHAYPILDEQEKVVGILTRQHLLRPRRKRVVLVDHNEMAQSVPGLKEAEILEIIDHHRLADIQTTNPIYVRNEPVGSTTTIVAGMFQERGLMPSKNLAGIMASAIITDTVMFKSPTCTERDKNMAERMARIAKVALQELGRDIFSASLEGKDARDLLFADYKEFHIAGHDFAIGQVTCVDSPGMLERKDSFLEEMAKIRADRRFSMVLLMLTDVLLEGTQLLFLGDEEVISQAFGVIPKDNMVFLPRVMSRKKQVVPSLSALWC